MSQVWPLATEAKSWNLRSLLEEVRTRMGGRRGLIGTQMTRTGLATTQLDASHHCAEGMLRGLRYHVQRTVPVPA